MKLAETDADGQIHGRMSYNYNFEIHMVCLFTVNILIWLEMGSVFVDFSRPDRAILPIGV
jgi:hypothetical protein